MWPCIQGSNESEVAWEEEQRGWCCRVNKVDCLIGRGVMNVVVIHSLKGHAVFLLTCGQPWLTCCHIVWYILTWTSTHQPRTHMHRVNKRLNKSFSGDIASLVAVVTRGQWRWRWRAHMAPHHLSTAARHTYRTRSCRESWTHAVLQFTLQVEYKCELDYVRVFSAARDILSYSHSW